MTIAVITGHSYEGADDGLYCTHDPGDPDVNLCSMPREAHDHPCMRAARPHDHLGDGWLVAYARDRSWKTVIPDDGSICQRDISAPVQKYDGNQVLALFIGGWLEQAEREYRRSKGGER